MKIRSLAAPLLLGMTVISCAVAAPPPTDFKELMRKELDAWSTLDTDKVAPFYPQGPDFALGGEAFWGPPGNKKRSACSAGLRLFDGIG